jgi:hypothetical protein
MTNGKGMGSRGQGFGVQKFFMKKENYPSGVKNRNRKALVTTDTELIAMAPPAIIGFRVGPLKI